VRGADRGQEGVDLLAAVAIVSVAQATEKM
jgi:hypothetical protein